MHVQAIVTKYIGPSNTRGSRIKARAAAGSITLPYDPALNSTENHIRAAKALADKFKWRGAWFGGGMPDDTGSVFVCAEESVMAANRYRGVAFVSHGEGEV